MTVEAVVEAGAVLTPPLYRKYWTEHFRTADYRNILLGRSVMGKRNRGRATGSCPAIERFRYGCIHSSGRVEQVGKYAKHMDGCLTVGHLGQGLGQPTEDRSYLSPCFRIKARQLVKKRRRRQLSVCHHPSLVSIRV